MSGERLTIDDFVVLGNAVPDSISDDRVTVCTAGYSPTHGLIRVYPVPPSSEMRRWNIVKVPLERNPRDTRPESWKIQGSRDEWDRIAQKIEKKGVVFPRSKQIELIDELQSRFGADCVNDLNGTKASFGFIRPSTLSCRFENRTDLDKSIQTTLGGNNPFKTIKNYGLKPVVEYRCPSCKAVKPHNQQLMEWGVFEWMRQHPESPGQVWENLHIGQEGYRINLLVGNMASHRNSFMVISIFRFKLYD